MKRISVSLLIVFSTFFYFSSGNNSVRSITKSVIKSIKEVEYTTLIIDLKVQTDSTLGSSVFHYDKNGLQYEMLHYDATGIQTNKFTFKYNKENNPIVMEQYSFESELINVWHYHYNTEGFDMIVYLNEGDEVQKANYQYDKKNRIIKEENFDLNDDLISSTFYRYDSSERIIEKEVYSTTYGNWRYKTTLDNNRNPIEILWADEIGMLISKTTTTYRYNTYGDWIWKLIKEDDGSPILTKREIKYY
jgi:hypothetical protein